MLLIALSWTFIFISLLNFGIVMKHLLRLNAYPHISILIILGQFLATLILSCWAFFYSVKLSFFIFLILFNMGCFWMFKSSIAAILKETRKTFSSFSKGYKGIFIAICILCLFQSASAPYLLDNESYYVQTIKWLNEYGFVKGLANLHPFFGQYSGWHILQSGFNFSFFGDFFNDINGFTYCVISFLAIQQLQAYETSKKPQDLILGLVPIFSVFFFPFISSPSQDLPIFLFSQIVFYVFLKQYNSFTKDCYYIVFCITIFMVYLKVTTLVLAIIPLVIFIKLIREEPKIILSSICIGGCVLLLFFSKNYIISGHPFFPSSALSFFKPDWIIPNEIQSYNYGYSRAYALLTSPEYYDSLSFFQKINSWLHLSKLRGLFNNGMALLIFLVPCVILCFKNRPKYYILYAIGVLHLLFLLSTSAQYRFYFNYFIFFVLLVLASLRVKQKIRMLMVITSLLIASIPVLIPLNLKSFTSNTFAMNMESFTFDQVLIPHQNSKHANTHKIELLGNFQYFSPKKEANHYNEAIFFWSTGNGELPCTSKEVLDFFETEYGYYPQMRGSSLGDGFKAVNYDRN